MSLDENAEMLEGFIADSRELLDEIEPMLIELQQASEDSGAADTDTINSIFRLFHSLKGAAGFLDLKNITRVTHEAETLLNLIRDNKFPLINDHTTALCRACDLIHALMTNIEQQGSDKGLEDTVEEVVTVLVQLVAAGGAPEKTPPDKTKSPAGSAGPPQPDLQKTLTPELLSGFIQESDELLESVESALVGLDTSDNRQDDLDTAFRSIHSFKGNCGFMGFKDPERLSHSIETALAGMRTGAIPCSENNINILLPAIDALRSTVAELSKGGSDTIQGCDLILEILEDLTGGRPESDQPLRLGEILVARGEASSAAVRSALEVQGKPRDKILNYIQEPAADSPDRPETDQKSPGTKKVMRRDIRVDLDKLDLMIDLVGELVIAQLMVTQNPDIQDYELENFDKASHHLQRVTSELQDIAISIRMVPLSATFRKMIRLVHDLSHKSGKKVKLDLIGEDTEVDKTVIEQIADPLVHLIRNAIDHGLEPAAKRKNLNKTETGNITLEAKHDGGEVLIIIRDDGAGLDRNKIFDKALKQGLVTEKDRNMSNEDVFKLIFEPGFSTAEKVTDVSGRGVGMDVVKKNLEKIKGTVDIKSNPGESSTFTLKIPLTLAIVDGMLVRVGQALYIIPLLAIRESFRPEPKNITFLPDGREVVRVREELIPVTRVYHLYNVKPEHTELHEGILVIIENQGENLCLFLDEVMGQQQTVIKALPGYMSDIDGVSGCSILGDGQVCLILDVGSLIKKSKKTSGKITEQEEPPGAG